MKINFEKTYRQSARVTRTRLGSRELPGTTETLVAKKLDSQRILFQKALSVFKKVITIR